MKLDINVGYFWFYWVFSTWLS